MILRKPYAFLIKNFRLIHFILFGLLGYICFKTKDIYSYFSSCIKSRNLVGEQSSIGLSIYILIFIAIFIFSVIMVLMNRKKKPSKLYLFSIIFYSFIIIALFFANSQLYNLLIQDSDIRVLNVSKDLLLISYVGQYLFLFMILFRAIGFNIKKFDFQNDLKELSILKEDNEEFVLDVDFDINDVKTRFKRYLRITKYVIRENKILVVVILGIVSLYIGTTLILNIFVYNKVYKENESFKVNDLTVKVLNSYDTKLDYKRDTIKKKNQKYNVVEVLITNNGKKAKELNTNYIKIQIDEKNSYKIDSNSNSYFSDLGTGYKKQKIKAGETKKFLFVFLVPDKDSEEVIFEMLINTTIKDNEYVYNYAKVKLNPKNTFKPKVVSSKELGESLNFDKSILKNSSLKIDEYSYSSYETYEYKETINNKEYTFSKVLIPNLNDYYGKVIMRLKVDEKFDESMFNINLTKKFYENFAQIRYYLNGKMYTYDNITEHYVENSEGFRYIDVPDYVVNSENVYLDIILRDLQYTYILK